MGSVMQDSSRQVTVYRISILIDRNSTIGARIVVEIGAGILSLERSIRFFQANKHSAYLSVTEQIL